MAEYVKRWDVSNACYDIFEEVVREGKAMTAEEVRQTMLRFEKAIRQTPTADVVEVVRCEECKCLMKEIVVEQTPYGFENEKNEFGCQRIFDLTGEWVDVMLDDFCSYGERRSE